jgi:nucleoside-diphosphate-sugar epimerase
LAALASTERRVSSGDRASVARRAHFEMAKCAHRRLRLPGLASAVAGWWTRRCRGLGLYRQKIHVLSEMNQTIACSIEKARAELGYRPVVDLEEGMRRSLKWVWQRQGGLV